MLSTATFGYPTFIVGAITSIPKMHYSKFSCTKKRSSTIVATLYIYIYIKIKDATSYNFLLIYLFWHNSKF